MPAQEDANKNRHLVFLYGTLKRNQPNNYQMTKKENGEARFICKASTVETYPLVIQPEFGIPFLLGRNDANIKEDHIKGEVYEVDNKMKKFLDDYERHPHIYTRTTVSVKVENSENEEYSPGDEISVETYILFNFSDILFDYPLTNEYDDNTQEIKLDRNLQSLDEKDLEPLFDKLGLLHWK